MARKTKQELVKYYGEIRKSGGQVGEFLLGYDLGQSDAREETRDYYSLVSAMQSTDSEGYLVGKGGRYTVIDSDGHRHFVKAGSPPEGEEETGC